MNISATRAIIASALLSLSVGCASPVSREDHFKRVDKAINKMHEEDAQRSKRAAIVRADQLKLMRARNKAREILTASEITRYHELIGKRSPTKIERKEKYAFEHILVERHERGEFAGTEEIKTAETERRDKRRAELIASGLNLDRSRTPFPYKVNLKSKSAKSVIAYHMNCIEEVLSTTVELHLILDPGYEVITNNPYSRLSGRANVALLYFVADLNTPVKEQLKANHSAQPVSVGFMDNRGNALGNLNVSVNTGNKYVHYGANRAIFFPYSYTKYGETATKKSGETIECDLPGPLEINII